ncbi:MAG: MarR family transcriptional regulator [Chloroflexi bacterium]|nr:MarR family transcriptional regulator [Chloroflexota bacterium]
MGRAEELAQSIVHRYLTLVRYQHLRGHQILKAYGISGKQLAVLRYLMESGPRSVGEISRFLYVRDATTSPLLERMENAGHIVRRRCTEDSRKVLVEPTEEGRRLAAIAPMGAISLMRTRLPQLPIEDLERMDEALKGLSEVIEVDESILD